MIGKLGTVLGPEDRVKNKVRKSCFWGCEAGLVVKVLAVKAWESEFRFPEPI